MPTIFDCPTSCLQDGKFIANFLITHPCDKNNQYHHKCYWIEYHKLLNPKRLHHEYHLIQPSDVSELKAEKEDLVPYHEWIDLTDNNIVIH